MHIFQHQQHEESKDTNGNDTSFPRSCSTSNQSMMIDNEILKKLQSEDRKNRTQGLTFLCKSILSEVR